MTLCEEVRHRQIARIVQVCRADEFMRCGEDPGEIGQVVAVALNLQGRMGDGPPTIVLDRHQGVAVLKPFRGTPLLELHDNVGRPPRGRVLARKEDVGTLARQRQLELDEHLHVVETGGDEVGAQGRDAALPASPLAWRGTASGLYRHLLG